MSGRDGIRGYGFLKEFTSIQEEPETEMNRCLEETNTLERSPGSKKTPKKELPLTTIDP